MMAAYTAAAGGHHVRLLEKNEKLGKKIYITGKGRCNFTNACDFPVFLKNIVSNPRFMYSAGQAFLPEDMVAFLEEAGCRTKVERGSRAFPASDHASDVTKALEQKMRAAGVEILLHTEVITVEKDTVPLESTSADMNAAEDGFCREGRPAFRVTARQVTNGHRAVFKADAVIVCTGGLSYSSTGSTGDGYRFAREAGLSVKDCVPALVPLCTKEDDYIPLQGVSLKNVSVRIIEPEGASGRKKKNKDVMWESEPGELLFTHFGLSGPLVLTASSLVSRGLSEDRTYFLEIDLKPGMNEEMLDNRILRDLENAQNMLLENALGKLLIASLRPVILKRAEISEEIRVRDLSREQRLRLVHEIKHMRYQLSGTRGFQEAIITQGGVDVKEIHPGTMESKKCPGLYFAGEVLDVDGFTGGFNLQIAWATGHAAGSAV